MRVLLVSFLALALASPAMAQVECVGQESGGQGAPAPCGGGGLRQAEAHILASLNHPNIAQIHGIEEDEGTRALVLELVEGPTLADRISKGPIPLDEALPIAKQIAEAAGFGPIDRVSLIG